MSNTTATSVQTVDVIVVGGGGAGLAAAIGAAGANRSVLILEKEPKLGGTTALSVGSISSSATDLQRRAGIVDTPAEHFEDMALFAEKFAGRDNLELRRLYTENVPGMMAWLERLGMVFFGPMPEPPHRVPRMHNVLPSSKAYTHHLWKEARRLGVKAILNAPAQKLIMTNGRVTGVEANVDGRPMQINATYGVVLASGDFSSGRALKQQYLAEDIRDIEGINPASTGDGQRIAVELGGDIVNGDIVFGPEIRFVVPPVNKLIDSIPPSTLLARIMRRSLTFVPPAILRPLLMMFVTTNLAPSPSLFQNGAILVNKLGKRFVDELGNPIFAIPRQPEQVAYIVFDHKVAAKFTGWPNFISTAPGLAYAYLADYKRNRRDIYFQGGSIAALAQALGVPADALAQTIEEHNRTPAGQAAPVVTPPFYALGPAKSFIPIADGGLRVNVNLQVLDRSGQWIPGLFAAGSTGQGGLVLEGHGHHLGWALTSGRIAGQNAARAKTA
jgi:fumarate reductase flavoprotein subunit